MFYVLQISFTNNCMYLSCTYKLAHQHQVAPRTAKLGHWNGPHRHRGHDGNPWYSFLIFAVFCIDCAHIEFNHEQFIIMNSWMLVWTIINTNHPFISKKTRYKLETIFTEHFSFVTYTRQSSTIQLFRKCKTQMASRHQNHICKGNLHKQKK